MLTADRLREAVSYDPETGIFRRKQPTRRVRVGSVCGSPDTNGYLLFRIDAKRYLAHRLAWLYSYGVWPSGDIDHINHDTSDNRLVNLRDVTRSTNMHNMRKPRHNASGVRGVCFDSTSRRWMAYVQVDRKFKNLGRFEKKEDAAVARAIAMSSLP